MFYLSLDTLGPAFNDEWFNQLPVRKRWALYVILPLLTAAVMPSALANESWAPPQCRPLIDLKQLETPSDHQPLD